jgi:23S rRNA (uracil1939-C5)-methyltransferase
LAALTGSETVLDLYCGTGSISLLLARRAKAVLGMEIIPEAIADAKINASINGIANVNFVTGKAEDLLPQMLAGGHATDLVVLDPPRKGCDPALLDALITADIKKLIYVSCNPATLARDIAILRSGDYQVRLIQPVDMFPWTNHVETAVLMSRTEAVKA